MLTDAVIITNTEQAPSTLYFHHPSAKLNSVQWHDQQEEATRSLPVYELTVA